MENECIHCFFEQTNRLFVKHNIQEGTARELFRKLNVFVEENRETALPIPEASGFLHRILKQELGNVDLYRKEKEDYNNLLMSLEEEIRIIIKRSADPFRTALQYALAGNVIDFGLPRSFDIFKSLSSAASSEPAINHSDLLKDELRKASKVLYLGDNTGEIVLDKLLIETIHHPNLYFAVRGGNIVNDVTMKDARKVGIAQIAHVISNGYDAPSTIIDKCSPAFKKLYNEAGVIISKGQGNLEGLIDQRDKNIFFLLMIKCKVIARKIGVQEGDVVILSNQSEYFQSMKSR